VYAIVKTGGKQYKVAVGDVVEVEKLDGAAGAAVTLPALITARKTSTWRCVSGGRAACIRRTISKPHENAK